MSCGHAKEEDLIIDLHQVKKTTKEIVETNKLR